MFRGLREVTSVPAINKITEDPVEACSTEVIATEVQNKYIIPAKRKIIPVDTKVSGRWRHDARVPSRGSAACTQQQ